MIDEQTIKEMEITTENIKAVFKDQDDVMYKVAFIRGEPELRADLVYVDGMADVSSINEDIIKPLNENPVFQRVNTQEGGLRSRRKRRYLSRLHGDVKRHGGAGKYPSFRFYGGRFRRY